MAVIIGTALWLGPGLAASQTISCPGGGTPPTPTDVTVGAMPIIVDSTTSDYFVLYVSHEIDADTTVDLPAP